MFINRQTLVSISHNCSESIISPFLLLLMAKLPSTFEVTRRLFAEVQSATAYRLYIYIYILGSISI